VFYGEWYRIVSSLFLHLTAGHLLWNLFALWLVGRYAENDIKLLLIPFYILCGCAGSLATLAFSPDTFGRGASDAIAGLLGLAMVGYVRRRNALSKGERRIALLFLVFCLALVLEAAFDRSPVAVSHAAGMALGIGLGALFQTSGMQNARPRLYALTTVAALLCFLGLLLSSQNKSLALKYAAAKQFDRGEYSVALLTINRFLESEPSGRSGSLIAAIVHFKMREYQESEKISRTVTARDEEDTYSKYLLGELDIRTGHCSETLAISQHLARLLSQYAKVLDAERCPSLDSSTPQELVRPNLASDPRIWLPGEFVVKLFP
jgi:rhomboid protease GluP